MKTAPTFLLLLLLAFGTGLQAQVPASYANRLQRSFDSLCSWYRVQGATAAVYIPGYGIWESASGESHAGVPMRPDMALPLNSNTKTYVAAALLKLQEAGLLSLDDTIGKWIPKNPDISGAISIRQLLNHTSGLYSYTDTAAFADSIESDFGRVWQPDEILKFVGRPLFAPGTDWYYSNTNYLLAGMIISRVSGQPVQTALRDLLLTPQGLTNTWFYPQETPSTDIPHFWFYSRSGAIDGADFGYMPQSFYSGANAAGALFGTAKDNVLFWQKLCSGGIINAASLAQWRQTVPLNSTIGYGLGMFRYADFNGRVVYEHGGTGAGAINENLVDSASGVCISVLTNQETIDNGLLLDFIVGALHRITLTPPTGVTLQGHAATWSLYPVPAASEIHISGLDLRAAPARYTIRDLTGRVISEGFTRGLVQLDGLGSGSYWLELELEQGRQPAGTRRFEVLR